MIDVTDWYCKRPNCPDTRTGLLPSYSTHEDGCPHYLGLVESPLPHYHITLGHGCEVKVPEGYGPDWVPRKHYCEMELAGDAIGRAVASLLPF
jgi:hypothetical protein